MYSFPIFEFGIETLGEYPVLVIEDQYDPDNPSMTVTNGAEWVLSRIAAEIGVETLPALVIYRDSEGHWAKLLVDGSRGFQGFAPIQRGRETPITDRREAVELAVLNYYYAQAV